MISLILIISLLWVVVLVSKRDISVFSKDKSIAVKGVLAILIVLHHLSKAGVAWLSEFSRWGTPVVSVFFFVSGYGIAKSLDMKGKGYLHTFWKHRVFDSLLLPYMIVVSGFIICLSILGHLPSVHQYFVNLVHFGSPLLPNSWFVWVLVLLYASFYFAAKLSIRHYTIIVILASAALVTLFVWAGYSRHLYMTLMSFSVGMLYSRYENHIISFYKRYCCRFWLIPVLFGFVGLGHLIPKVPFNLLGYVAIALIVILLISSIDVECLSRNRFSKLLSDISYEIYLIHGAVIAILGEVISSADSSILFVASTFLLSILLAWGVHRMDKWIVAKGI